MITITSRNGRFRRAGVAHTPEPVEYDDDDFTEEQMMQLGDESALLIELSPDSKWLEENEETDGFAQLIAACGELDQDKTNKNHWTQSGMPQIAALEGLSGVKNITATDRDLAYGAYLEKAVA